jgi:beta-lactamase regulating signal transducer with metallopeptidase domain
MERLFWECAVRAALLIGGTAIALYAVRVKVASVKHSIWTGVLALMLVLPFLTGWGPKVSLRLLPPLAEIAASQAIAPAGTHSTGFLASTPMPTWEAVLFGVYLLGLFLLLFRLTIGTLRARRLIRDAVFDDSMRTSPSCAAPVTVGFFRPVVILPEHWRQWPQAQLNAVLTHEGEHARRRDSLIQWLALLNRALFWFHPLAWWLERNLSALAEEACDNVVLGSGHNPHEYAEYLMDMARSVSRSGGRLNVAGMAMPGSFLPQRIRKIMEGGLVANISRVRIVCVAVACATICSAFAAGNLDHARRSPSAHSAIAPGVPAVPPTAKFLLGDLKIEGDVHDRDGVRSRILKAWKDRAYDDGKELADEAAAGIRADFQERGYFKVVVGEPVSRPHGLSDGRQRVSLTASIAEGDQFRLGTLTIQNSTSDRALSIPVTTLRQQFHLQKEDVFNMSEIRAGLGRMKELYGVGGYPDFTVAPDTEIDSASHHIDLILRITEGQHKP